MKRKKSHGTENVKPLVREATVMPVSGKMTGVFVAVLLAGAAITYANALNGIFVFDDLSQILDNPYIRSWQNLPVIFGSGFGRLHITGANYYRPLLELSYMIDNTLWGRTAAGYHLTNVMVHTTAVIALFFLIKRLFRDASIAFFTALLFCVHPINTSGVTYVSGRADSMVIAFMLFSFIFILKYFSDTKSGVSFLLTGALFFLLSLLTKESAVFFLPVIFLYRFCQERESNGYAGRAKWPMVYVALSVVLLVYGAIRAHALAGLFVAKFNVAAMVPIGDRVLTGIRSFLDYLMLILVPAGLRFERTTALVTSIFDLRTLASVVAIGLFIFALVRCKDKNGPVFCGLAWFLLMFLPISNLIIPLNAFIAENWIQLPALGIFLAVSGIVVQTYRQPIGESGRVKYVLRKCVMTCFILAVICYATLTIARNNEYADAVVFYKSALKYEPDSVKLLNNLGVEYQNRKDLESAAGLFKRALAVKPDHSSSLNNLATIYIKKERYDEAIELLIKALKIEENDTSLLNNLGIAYVYKGDKSNALHCWRRSLELNPNQPKIQEYISRNTQSQPR